MYAVATCTISILRGTANDPVYGDTFATSQVIASGVPASIIERTQKIVTPGNAAPRIVRSIDGIVGSQIDITDADRIRDEKTGQVYVVIAVINSALPGMTSDTQLELRRTS